MAVAVELAADDVALGKWADRFEYCRLGIAQRGGVVPERGLHRQQRDRLEQVVLQHVADRADLLVEAPPASHPEVLGHRQMHRRDVLAVPDRLKERVSEPEVGDVLDRLLAQIVIDPVHLLLGEHRVQHAAQLARGCQIASERLLDHDPRPPRAPARVEALRDRLEQARGDREIVQRPPRAIELTRDRVKRRAVAVVTVDVMQQREQPLERVLSDRIGVLAHARARVLAKALQIPAGARDTEHRHRQSAVADHRIQRGEDLLIGQIAARAEEHQRVRPTAAAHHHRPHSIGSAPAC